MIPHQRSGDQANPRSASVLASELDDIIDSSPTSMLLATREEGILRAIRSAVALTGLSADEMSERGLIHTVVHPDDVSSVTWVGDEILD